MIRVLVAAAAMLSLACVPAFAELPAAAPYKDAPSSAWFKSLASPYEPNCCDQADCKLAKSDYRSGVWWALSNRTQTWVEIAPDQITHDKDGHEVVSVFKDAVLCEGDPNQSRTANPPRPRVYCFAPPPLGF